jgi:CRISPR-associated protein Csb3
MMATSSIPVDLRNPGQVFACLGLMEAAEILIGPATGGFVGQKPETQVRFTLTTPGADDPVLTVLRFLTQAEVVALAPAGSDLAAKEPGVGTQDAVPSATYPCPLPETPSALPAILVGPGGDFPISSWADGAHIGRDNMKFWAGAGGYSGAALTRDALDLVRPLAGDGLPAAAADPFAFARPQSSSFRFAWQRDYTALDVGFSPNDHPEIRMVGYPLVELLAAIGLQHARPLRLNKLLYRYGVWGVELPTLFARAMLGLGNPGFPIRTFTMKLGWPGQEGQARCITDALEDFQS